jgi:hypothetical protein
LDRSEGESVILKLTESELREAVHAWLLAPPRRMAVDLTSIRLQVNERRAWVEAEYEPPPPAKAGPPDDYAHDPGGCVGTVVTADGLGRTDSCR